MFNSYAITQHSEEALLQNDNPFALVVLANFYLLKTKTDSEKRYEFKEKLYELAKNRVITTLTISQNCLYL